MRERKKHKSSTPNEPRKSEWRLLEEKQRNVTYFTMDECRRFFYQQQCKKSHFVKII